VFCALLIVFVCQLWFAFLTAFNVDYMLILQPVIFSFPKLLVASTFWYICNVCIWNFERDAGVAAMQNDGKRRGRTEKVIVFVAVEEAAIRAFVIILLLLAYTRLYQFPIKKRKKATAKSSRGLDTHHSLKTCEIRIIILVCQWTKLRKNGVLDIPTEFFQLTKLKELRMTANFIRDTIPTEIEKLTLLEKLTLYSNSLLGTVPEELWLMKDLNEMTLYENIIWGGVCPILSVIMYVT